MALAMATSRMKSLYPNPTRTLPQRLPGFWREKCKAMYNIHHEANAALFG